MKRFNIYLTFIIFYTKPVLKIFLKGKYIKDIFLGLYGFKNH